MNIVLKGVLEEELERNLQKQRVFLNELNKLEKGSIHIIVIKNNKYVYRKFRKENRVHTVYIGLYDSKEANAAFDMRNRYLSLKKDIKDLIKEEKELSKILGKR